jgi:hypothetical protein
MIIYSYLPKIASDGAFSPNEHYKSLKKIFHECWFLKFLSMSSWVYNINDGLLDMKYDFFTGQDQRTLTKL